LRYASLEEIELKKLRRRARNVVSRRRLLLALKSPAPSGLAGSKRSRFELVHNQTGLVLAHEKKEAAGKGDLFLLTGRAANRNRTGDRRHTDDTAKRNLRSDKSESEASGKQNDADHGKKTFRD
jgi:hypothetical protein